jgi:hypothetical protein
MADSRSRNAYRKAAIWAGRRGAFAVAAVVALGAGTLNACAGVNPSGPQAAARDEASAIPNELTGTFEPVTYGDPAPRIRALRAIATGSGSVRLRMVRTTVEGDPITYYLIVDGGSARLFVDWRQDRFGGGRAITEDRLTNLWLVRMNVGDEPPSRVDPDSRLPAGVYALHGLVCPDPASCLREF